ncbi:MAG: DUF2399 domain-containing protein [Kiritimatiellae bacterium]|nr:DUF2399 domain-containing protein [Kiritimatiellia bacterium]
MNDSLLNKAAIEAAVEKAPVVCDIVKKLASKVARGVRLPETFSAKGLNYDAQRELEHLFGTVGQRTADGRFYLQIHSFLRDPIMWRGALEYFGLAKVADGDGDDEDVFVRLKLLEPELSSFIDKLAANEEVLRFLATPENRKDWMQLFRSFVGRFDGPECGLVTTLSQLGSDWFGDSKKLRSGGLRRQLVIIAATLADSPADDERRALEGALIVDNPYTSSVTFSAPVYLVMKDGAVFDYPRDYYVRRMATQLPLETVLEIAEVRWAGKPRAVTTSENAAPFANMVRKGDACVYTGGYPCLAVKMFLHKLGKTGSECNHEGDADLDGFRIASEIGKCIALKRVVAADILECAAPDAGRELTSDQSKRAWAFLANPQWKNFRFADDVKRILFRGRWIEQESFGTIIRKSKKGPVR